MVVVPFLQKYTQKEQAKREQARLEQSQFEGEGEVVLFLEVGVDDGEVVKEDGHQVGAVEVVVAETRDILLDKRHTVEIAQEHPAGDTCALLGGGRSSRLSGGRSGINTLVAEFAEKASVAVVDLIGDASEVADIVVGGHSVDMVDGHACGYLLIAPGDIDGMRGTDSFTITESMTELQILGFAVFLWPIYPIRIREYFLSVRIDADAYYPALAVVDIEGDVILGVRADIGDPHVVKEER